MVLPFGEQTAGLEQCQQTFLNSKLLHILVGKYTPKTYIRWDMISPHSRKRADTPPHRMKRLYECYNREGRRTTWDFLSFYGPTTVHQYTCDQQHTKNYFDKSDRICNQIIPACDQFVGNSITVWYDFNFRQGAHPTLQGSVTLWQRDTRKRTFLFQ